MPIEAQWQDNMQSSAERNLAAQASPAQSPSRDVWRAMVRGFAGCCPQCGTRGGLFRAFLKVHDHCPHCEEALHHQRADDAPPYFVIAIVGKIVVSLALTLELTVQPAYWVHAVLWGPLTVALAIALLPPVKGTIIGLQWANRMHGFDPHSPDHEADLLALAASKP